MQELCDLLPEECDYVDIPDVYDARFSDEIIEGMLWAAQLKSKFWEWADLYFKALSPLVHEMRRQEENLDRLTDQIEEIKKKYFQKKQARSTLPLTAPLPLLDDIR